MAVIGINGKVCRLLKVRRVYGYRLPGIIVWNRR